MRRMGANLVRDKDKERRQWWVVNDNVLFIDSRWLMFAMMQRDG